MSKKTISIIGWVLTALLAFAFISSAVMKLTGNEQALKGAVAWGISAGTLKLLGLVEIISIVLFIIPRTGVLGTLLLAAYMGGAIATHMEHNLPVMAPILIQCMVWITAAIRFPELTTRLKGNNAMV